MEEFEQAARVAGYSNFTRNGRVYAHADLETFWRGYKAAKAAQPQASAAQSAPAGEREAAVEAAYAAVVEGGWSSVKEMGVEMFQAGAAWQRTQSAGVPVAPGWHRVVSTDWLKRIHRDLDACQKLIWANLRGCDPSYCEDAQARLAEIDAMLAAAPAQPAAQDDDTPSEGWPAYHKRKMTTMLDLMRGLRDRYKVRLAAAHDQGEVQRLLSDTEALEGCREWLKTQELSINVGDVELEGHDSYVESSAGWLLRLLDAALAASTGQEG